MRNNRQLFERFSNSNIFLLVTAIFFSKIIAFVLMEYDILIINLGGGSDANYYNSYAEGFTDTAVNIWPVLLRWLNDFGLYSRDLTTYFLFFLSLIVIPIMVVRLSGLTFKRNQKYYLYALLVCLIHPTIFFFSTDIFRDIFMAFSFLLGCLTVKWFLNSNSVFGAVCYFLLSVAIGFFLIEIRPYLGYAYLLSLLFLKIKFTKSRAFYLGLLYLGLLFAANYLGVLDLLTEYRSGFEESEGGSTLGLSFSNPILFIPNFIISFLGQMLGLYITNPLALVLFVLETVPFFFMLIYVLKNIKLADSFVRFLIIFFVFYGSVWLIGNDNLGTAVRLRIYNYLAIYISFFYILRLKRSSFRKSSSNRV